MSFRIATEEELKELTVASATAKMPKSDGLGCQTFWDGSAACCVWRKPQITTDTPRMSFEKDDVLLFEVRRVSGDGEKVRVGLRPHANVRLLPNQVAFFSIWDDIHPQPTKGGLLPRTMRDVYLVKKVKGVVKSTLISSLKSSPQIGLGDTVAGVVVFRKVVEDVQRAGQFVLFLSVRLLALIDPKFKDCRVEDLYDHVQASGYADTSQFASQGIAGTNFEVLGKPEVTLQKVLDVKRPIDPNDGDTDDDADDPMKDMTLGQDPWE